MLAIGAAGAATSAYGAFSGAEAQSSNAAYQAQVAANNAAIAQRNARMDIQSGEVQASDSELKTRATVGQEKAAQGGAGVDVNTGSAANVRQATEQVGQLNALTIRSNAAKSAYGQEVAATGDTASSQLLGAESSQYATAAPIGATGTLLTGASTVGGKYATLAGATPSSSANVGTGGVGLNLDTTGSLY